MSYLSDYKTRETVTPQNRPIPGSGQVKNNAGGFSWEVNDWTRLERFLILGSAEGSYYTGERALTVENAKAVERCIEADGVRTVDTIVRISEAGRAPKNDPALFALALCAGTGDERTRKHALDNLPRVARIGTHLFHFAEYVQGFRGWGRGLRRAIGAWYQEKPVDQLAYQLVKYQGRDGWSHRDLLRLAHPQAQDPARNLLYKWVVDGLDEIPSGQNWRLPTLVTAFEGLKGAQSAQEVAYAIRDWKLPREAVPSEFLKGDPKNAKVWEALLEDGGLTMVIRNLATMTRAGILAERSDATRKILAMMTGENLRKARVHPLQVLVALKTYQQGHGERGGNTWTPVQRIVDGLDGAFYESFQHVTPTGKAHLLAIDVSGSMSWSTIAGMPGITPRIGAGAMALVTASVEPDYEIMAFSHTLVKAPITPRMRLDDALKVLDRISMGGTDCSLPMRYAMNTGQRFDAFQIFTDSETWAGSIHPSQALKQYRQQFIQDARLIVVGMVSNGFSIADPNDPGMLDVVGYDTATPQIMADFVR